MTVPPASPPISPHPGPKKESAGFKHSPKMSIDLSTIPPLVPPSPPSNTLIITNLNNSTTFSASHLQSLYNSLSQPTPLNSFSPLPSFHRLIISYPTIDAAIATRQLLESIPNLSSTFTPSLDDSPANASENDHAAGAASTHSSENKSRTHNNNGGERVKVYFGAHTPLVGSSELEDTHLKAPSLGKLLFISPPPSPPCGWEIREEDPPNRETHAEDLERALRGLSSPSMTEIDPGTGMNPQQQQQPEASFTNSTNSMTNSQSSQQKQTTENDESRRRGSASSTTSQTSNTANTKRQGLPSQGRRNTITVYHPRDHGVGDNIPQVMVEDTAGDDEGDDEGMGNDSTMTGDQMKNEYDDEENDMNEMDMGSGTGNGPNRRNVVLTRTARPPVELMEQ